MEDKIIDMFFEIIDGQQEDLKKLCNLCEDIITELKDGVLQGNVDKSLAKRIVKDIEATSSQCMNRNDVEMDRLDKLLLGCLEED